MAGVLHKINKNMNLSERVKENFKDIIIPTLLGIVLIKCYPDISPFKHWALMFIAYGLVKFIREYKHLKEPFKNGDVLDKQEECLIIHNNFKSIPEEPKTTPMTEQEQKIINKLYSLLGTRKVGITPFTEHIKYYWFKIAEKTFINIKKQSFTDEETIYEVTYDEPRIHNMILEHPSTEAIEALEDIINCIKDKIDIQKLEEEQEKIDSFLKL